MISYDYDVEVPLVPVLAATKEEMKKKHAELIKKYKTAEKALREYERQVRTVNGLENIIFVNRSDAEKVIEDLMFIGMTKPVITVHDFYETTWIVDPNEELNKVHGWIIDDIEETRIRRHLDGYFIDLPVPKMYHDKQYQAKEETND